MIVSTDKDYIQTKQIKQGKEKLKEPFLTLVNWIDDNYGVRPLNISYEVIEYHNNYTRPRLKIIFEFCKDTEKLSTDGTFITDSIEAKIIDKFDQLFDNHPEFTRKNMFVLSGTFETIAREEINWNIPEPEIQMLKAELERYNVWTIHRLFSTTTFFLYTDKQVEECLKSKTDQLFADKYFTLLKKYDEFNYLKQDAYSISVGSKENFDTNYESNWFYYDR